MVGPRRQPPEWWQWELELTPHVFKRMVDRQFSEVDLRTMLADMTDYEPEPDGRFVLHTGLGGRRWDVVVEPDVVDRVLLVITAYPCE
jgi:hypothetical protein